MLQPLTTTQNPVSPALMPGTQYDAECYPLADTIIQSLTNYGDYSPARERFAGLFHDGEVTGSILRFDPSLNLRDLHFICKQEWKETPSIDHEVGQALGIVFRWIIFEALPVETD